MSEGRPKKLVIWAFDSAKFNRTVGGQPFIAQANPESFSLSYALQYNHKRSKGKSKYNPKWSGNQPRKLSFEFIIDGTGAIPNANQNFRASDSVAAQVSFLESIVFKYNGKRHSPNFLSIEWGALVFWCRLESMNVAYKLFEPNGQPLRASVKATFFEVIRRQLQLREENSSSPDVTHVFTIKEGDSLPQLAEDMYGNSAYYIAVAQSQKLIQFRNLQAGKSILFPPIKKGHD